MTVLSGMSFRKVMFDIGNVRLEERKVNLAIESWQTQFASLKEGKVLGDSL
jgi:hypothetical protein